MEASLRRLQGVGFVSVEGDRYALTEAARGLLARSAGGTVWDEWERLRLALEALPVPDVRD